MKVWILQGIPGSGKTSHIPTGSKVVSADHFFTDEKGDYHFNPRLLGEAHQKCLRDFVDYIKTGAFTAEDTLVVDNTNTTLGEVAPYYAVAEAYGLNPVIIHYDCSPELGAARNLHGVGLDACKSMHARIAKFSESMPPWWRRVSSSEVGGE